MPTVGWSGLSILGDGERALVERLGPRRSRLGPDREAQSTNSCRELRVLLPMPLAGEEDRVGPWRGPGFECRRRLHRPHYY